MAISSLSLPEQVLALAQAGREVIQDFCPLARSLEWELGQQYLRLRGNKAFISDASPVPFVINNDGALSRNAAEVFFASLLAAEGQLTLEPDLFVLELGIGVGLFARFFLDHFQQLCREHKKDFYDRLCYVAADRSERMLLDALRHGVFAHHAGHVRVRQVDAMQPDTTLPKDVMFRTLRGKPFRAVLLNYLLDCLPAAVLEVKDQTVTQLCVRTCLARHIRLEEHTDLTLKQLRARASAQDPKVRDELLEVYGLFASEYDYRPVSIAELPHGEFALDYARRTTGKVQHSYGAIQALDKLLDLVADDGLILINDYGPTKSDAETQDHFEHQRFSLATFVGVNFPLLRDYYEAQKLRWVEPAGDSRGIHSRLLSRTPAEETVASFQEHFSDAAFERLQAPIQKARGCLKAGRFELAAAFYRQAIELQPGNWVLLAEVSSFLTFQLRDPKAGADLAKLALEKNPSCSAELWNTLGDALFEWGRTAEARSAYRKALTVNEADVRSRLNLAWCHQRERDYPAALRRIAEAIGLDKTGEYRERLLQKQQEILSQTTLKHQREYLLLINLVSRYGKPEQPAENAKA